MMKEQPMEKVFRKSIRIGDHKFTGLAKFRGSWHPVDNCGRTWDWFAYVANLRRTINPNIDCFIER